MQRVGEGKWAVDRSRVRGRRRPIALASLLALPVALGGGYGAYLLLWWGGQQPAPARSSGPSIYVLGDSFAEAEDFQAQLRDQLPGRNLVFDGVGGSDMVQQAQRFTGIERDHLLVVLDGGLTDADALGGLRAILGGLGGECVRWIYVEPPPTPSVGFRDSEGYQRHAREVQSIRAAYPQHFLALTERLRAAADGGERDRADLAAGWIPASVRRDNIHLNERGNALLARMIAARVRQMGRSACG